MDNKCCEKNNICDHKEIIFTRLIENLQRKLGTFNFPCDGKKRPIYLPIDPENLSFDVSNLSKFTFIVEIIQIVNGIEKAKFHYVLEGEKRSIIANDVIGIYIIGTVKSKNNNTPSLYSYYTGVWGEFKIKIL